MTQIILSSNTVGTYPGAASTSEAGTYLASLNPTTAYYGYPNLIIGYSSSAGNCNGIFSFSGINQIPAGSTINSVVIAMAIQGSTNPSLDFDFHELLASITIASSNWNTTDGTTAWNTAGALGDGTDRSATVAATITMTNVNNTYFLTTSNTTIVALLQSYLNASANTVGFVLEPTTYPATYYRDVIPFSGTDGYRPAMIIDYSAGSRPWIANGTFWEQI